MLAERGRKLMVISSPPLGAYPVRPSYSPVYLFTPFPPWSRPDD